MKDLTNEKGFSKLELITVLCAFLILIAIGVYSISDNTKKGEFSAFKKLADSYLYNVNMFKDQYPSMDNNYYLEDLLNKKFIDSLTSPFDKKTSCDHYETKVTIENSKRTFIIRCEDYIIEGIYGQEYKVYQVGKWTKEFDETKNLESKKLYNYNKDGIQMLDKYYLEKEFLAKFNEKEGTNYQNISVISDGSIEVVEDIFYRTKEFIREF